MACRSLILSSQNLRLITKVRGNGHLTRGKQLKTRGSVQAHPIVIREQLTRATHVSNVLN
jgi:hypothetical protein